jgi:hypothetical protein
VTKSVEYLLLKKITTKKLRSKEKFAKTLTSFRQNNEVNIQNLKKIVKFIIDSYNQESLPYKVLAFDIQEIMRQHLNNLTSCLNSQSDQREDLICYINKTISERVNLLSEAQRIGTSRQVDFGESPAKSMGTRKNSQSNYSNVKRSKTGAKKMSFVATSNTEGGLVLSSGSRGPYQGSSGKKATPRFESGNPYATGTPHTKNPSVSQAATSLGGTATSAQFLHHAASLSILSQPP